MSSSSNNHNKIPSNTMNASSLNKDPDDAVVNDQLVEQFISHLLSTNQREELEASLVQFVGHHVPHHRPLAVVTSGGTAADLEANVVRSLENFSTGQRGAISVEQLLERGYAVIHLWRIGSASPYGRLLSHYLGIKPHHGLTCQSLGQLFASLNGEEDDDDNLLVQTVLEQQDQDPWLSDPSPTSSSDGTAAASSNQSFTRHNQDDILLHRKLARNPRLAKALQERSSALKENRLLTVPFRTVEEYLAKLKLIALSVNDCHSLALFYLAAAVSDYYVPADKKSQHKIQSKGGSSTLQLELEPVPKTLGLLRRHWAPHAFLASFKLETDTAILKQKAQAACQSYGCHLVIGNLLHNRHEKVWILQPSSTADVAANNNNNNDDDIANKWPMEEVVKPPSSHPDALEAAMMDFVVMSHFTYIAQHGHGGLQQGLLASQQKMAALNKKKQQQEKQEWVAAVKQHALSVAGVALGVVLSTLINAALQRRANQFYAARR